MSRELMDAPGLDPTEHRRALAGLLRINALSRVHHALWSELHPLFDAAPGATMRVLDVACGGGDVGLRLERLAARRGRSVIVDGCDASATALATARRAATAAGSPAQYFELDVLREPLPAGYDAIVCSLFLHHLTDREGAALLASMAGATRRLIVVCDLVRTRLAYWLAWCGSRVLSRSYIVHVDAPLSVAAALRPDEALQLARRAGLDGATCRRIWPQRFLLAWSRR